ncbi:MAG: hypothetical protein Q9172_003335, partial [Xanthocarpia lactea]
GILALLGWAVTAIAQGRLGIGDQSACAPTYTSFEYVGCYGDANNGGKAGFPFRLVTAQGDPKSFPGYTSTANLTVNLCTTACRAHGFKYALLYAGIECWCSSQLPYPAPPASADTSNGNGPYLGSSPGTPSPGTSCGTVCPGNSSQICGGQSHGSVYADQSYVNDTSPATIGVAPNYDYFGCYVNSGGGPGFLQIHAPTTESCQNYCGGLGYAFSTRNNVDSPAGTPGNNCQCGGEIIAGLQVAEAQCNRYCNGTLGAAGGFGTCGGSGSQFSVFLNPRLQGCYIPRQPGTDATRTYVPPANAGRAASSTALSSTVFDFASDDVKLVGPNRFLCFSTG